MRLRLPRRLPGGARAARWGSIGASIGALAGLAFAAASQPVYRGSATVTPSGVGVDVPPARVVELVDAEATVDEAALRLGSDLPGADLLTDVGARETDGAVEVFAESDRAEQAAAVAQAFAEAVVEVIETRQRRRIRQARDALRDELELLDPASLEAQELAVRIAGLDAELATGAGLVADPGASGAAVASGERSGPLWLLIGGLAGGLAGVALAGTGRTAPLLGRMPPEAIPVREVVATTSSIEPRSAHAAATAGVPPPSVVCVANLDGDRARELALAVTVGATAGGRRSLLIDCRIGTGGQAGALGVDPAPGLADYLRSVAGPREVLRSLDGAGPGLAVLLPSGDPAGSDPAELLASHLFEALVRRTSRVYDLLVLDAPGPLENPRLARRCAELAQATVLAAATDPSPDRLMEAAGVLTGLPDVSCARLSP